MQPVNASISVRHSLKACAYTPFRTTSFRLFVSGFRTKSASAIVGQARRGRRLQLGGPCYAPERRPERAARPAAMADEAEDTYVVALERAPPREPLAWKKAVAGASSGVVCCAIFSPLDVVRTRLQVQGALHNAAMPAYSGIVGTLSRIQREEGIRGWFRGFAPAILTVPVFWSLYFPLYDRLKPTVAEALQTDTRHAPRRALPVAPLSACPSLLGRPRFGPPR